MSRHQPPGRNPAQPPATARATPAGRPTAGPAQGAVPLGRLLARTCAAEWTRLWTVRSTWWFLAAAAVAMVGLGLVAGTDAAGSPSEADGEAAWLVSRVATFPAQFALLGLALTAVTADHATGGIVPTLQWTPRRSVLFWARAVVAAAAATVAGVLLAALAAVTAYVVARPVLRLPWREGLESLGTVALVLGAGTLLAVGLGAWLRSTAGGLVSVFLLVLVLPVLLPQLGYAWLVSVADLLPGVASLFLLVGEPAGRGLGDASATLTVLAWAVGALGLGWWRLVRADADR